jgi:phospholipase/carboxylesterase
MSFALTLDGPRFGPAAGGAPRQLVVLLHGWGADGNDLIGLAPHWARLLPQAEFLSPHAPYPHDGGFGRQWYSLGDLSPQGGLRDDVMRARVEAVAPIVDAYLDEALEARKLGAEKLALVGFSQGTMVALFVGPRRARGPAAILGYSGRMISGERLAAEAKSKPAILLIHGEDDEVLPAELSRRAAAHLRQAGFAVEAIFRPGLGHGIDQEGVASGGAFLKRALGA